MNGLHIDADGRVQRLRPQAASRSAFDRILFAEDLSELLQAGLTVREALEVMAQGQTRASDRQALWALQARIISGSALSDAMQRDESTFGTVLVALVRAAERTAGLPESLARHARTARRLEALGSRTITALVYPALLLTVGLAVLAFLLGWVLPGFSQVLQDGAQQLTPLARAILAAGAWLGAHRQIWIGLLVLLAVLCAAALLEPRSRLQMLEWATRLPGLSHTLRLLHASRFFSTVATLTQGGLTAVQALELAVPLLLPQGRAHLEQAVRQLRSGQPLASSLEGEVFGDEVVARLLEVGQRTGELPRTLERISTLLEARTARRVERLSRSLEPVLMVLLGALVGGVVLMMYVPLIELSAGMP